MSDDTTYKFTHRIEVANAENGPPKLLICIRNYTGNNLNLTLQLPIPCFNSCMIKKIPPDNSHFTLLSYKHRDSFNSFSLNEEKTVQGHPRNFYKQRSINYINL